MVVHQNVDGEVIVINMETGAYFSLSDSGAVIWDYIVAQLPVAAIVPELVQAYGGMSDEMEAVVTQFVAELQAEGLVVPDETNGSEHAVPPPAKPVPVQPGTPFEAPRLEKFTDMQEFILLDPIYELEASGWPDLESASNAQRH
jgi:hypothetical protein